MHIDRLISALNKYWRPIDKDYFWNKMDLPGTQQAIQVAEFPERISNWIWETERKPFEVF